MRIVFVRGAVLLLLMEGRLSPEGRRVAGDAAERAQELRVVGAELEPAGGERLGVRLLGRPEAAEAAARVERAERAAAGCVTGPRQGVPCATITQGTPARLHSTQTLWLSTFGRRPAMNAPTTSSSWCLLIGQPCSSKSTWTWSAIAVEVRSVEMYSGFA